MNNQSKFVKAFSDALGIEVEKITDDLAYNTIAEWDSTAHMMLIAELESVFDIMLDTDDIIEMSSVAVARNILKKYEIEC